MGVATMKSTRGVKHAAKGAAAPVAGEVWRRRDLLGLHGLAPGEVRALLRETQRHDEGGSAGERPLEGRFVANLFYEDSTRTRNSFFVAARRLGADVLDFSATGSSVSKGESLTDTARTIEALGVCAIAIRHSAAGAAEMVARAVQCSVINAGDGRHEHPTQGLIDLYTLAKAHGRLASLDLGGLRVAIVGDIEHSRVARSAAAGVALLGGSAVCVGPANLATPEAGAAGCEVTNDFDPVIEGADAIMMLRVQVERGAAIASREEYVAGYQLTPERAARMKRGAIVMHPGPMNRGVEIHSDVADGPRSVIVRQVAHGVPVRMSVLAACVAARAGAA